MGKVSAMFASALEEKKAGKGWGWGGRKGVEEESWRSPFGLGLGGIPVALPPVLEPVADLGEGEAGDLG